MYQRRMSVGDPVATGRVVDGSRLDDRIGALKSRVGEILRRFDRRIVRRDDSSKSAEDDAHIASDRVEEGRRRRNYR